MNSQKVINLLCQSKYLIKLNSVGHRLKQENNSLEQWQNNHDSLPRYKSSIR